MNRDTAKPSCNTNLLMGVIDQSLVFWDLAVEMAKLKGVDEVFPHLNAALQAVLVGWVLGTCSFSGKCRQD